MDQTPTILRTIIAKKHEEVETLLSKKSLSDLEKEAQDASEARGFVKAIERKIAAGLPAVIAEIKKASPSKGVIRESFQPADIAGSYERAGAACLSVLTDRDFFQGANQDLIAARANCALPIIRKDFMVHRAQIAEARAMGADCVLLIAAALSKDALSDLHQYANAMGLDVLVEIHNRQELENTQHLGNRLIGINNRNLHTFETRLETTFDLLKDIGSEQVVITESGIHSRDDVLAMQSARVNGFLVGEAFMREPDPGAALQNLFFRN